MRDAAPQHVPIAQPRAAKGPVPWAIDGKPARTIARAAAKACIDPAQGVDAKGLRTGAVDWGHFPRGGGQVGRRAGGHRVTLGHVFVTGLGLSIVAEPRLPKEIPGKPRHPSARVDVRIDRVAHARAPVFIVPDEDRAGVACQAVGVGIKVVERGKVQIIARCFGPAGEMAFIAGPTARGVFLGIAIGIGPFHIRITRHLAVFRRLFRQGAGGTGWQLAKAARPRALGGHHRGKFVPARSGDPFVMVRPAPAIIGQPCAGGADQHIRRARQMSGAADQDQVVFLDPVAVAFSA